MNLAVEGDTRREMDHFSHSRALLTVVVEGWYRVDCWREREEVVESGGYVGIGIDGSLMVARRARGRAADEVL